MYLLNAGALADREVPVYAIHSVEGGAHSIAILEGRWGQIHAWFVTVATRAGSSET